MPPAPSTPPIARDIVSSHIQTTLFRPVPTAARPLKGRGRTEAPRLVSRLLTLLPGIRGGLGAAGIVSPEPPEPRPAPGLGGPREDNARGPQHAQDRRQQRQQ